MKRILTILILISAGQICQAEYPIYKESGGLYIQSGNTTIAPNGDLYFTYGNTTITPEKTYYNSENTSFGSDGSIQIKNRNYIYGQNDNDLKLYYSR